MRALIFSTLLVIEVVLPGSTAAAGRVEPAVLGNLGNLGNLTWRNIGPALMGGRIADFAVPESDTDVIYAATATGGLWKTANRGTTWEPVFENGGTASLGDAAVAPSNANVVWLATGEPWNARSSSYGNGVYKSKTAAGPGSTTELRTSD